jgi:hypothetical protein
VLKKPYESILQEEGYRIYLEILIVSSSLTDYGTGHNQGKIGLRYPHKYSVQSCC